MLKSLDLFGFKSFADRTRFDFDPGITAVVGPNGSGKSNVVDAIKWILGDQSAKSLRGSDMMDVIFNGTGAAGRKASAFAEATITIDNSSGFLPIDSQEVGIGRRLWRSGDAEYLINGNVARLKDVRSLFMGTGAGTAAYCIIEQGRVDQIFKVNSTSRRVVFEEAAGISRFKTRKVEALRKLDRVEQNLTRLADIVDEVEAQLNATRSQAEKAAKYRELSKELRELWTGLAADDCRHFSGKVKEAEQQAETERARLEELAAQQESLEAEVADLDGAISEIDDQLRAVEQASASTRESAARHESLIRHQTTRSRELEVELVELRQRRSMMRLRTREVDDEIGHTQDQLTRFELQFTELQQEIEDRDARLEEVKSSLTADREALAAERRQLLDQMRAVSDAESRVTGLEAQRETIETALESAQNQASELEVRIATAANDAAEKQQLLEEADAQVAEAEAALNELRGERETLLSDQSGYQQSLAELRERRSAGQARRSVLEDLEFRQEGLGIGVKEILQRAEKIDSPPWNRIHGSVADLLDVDLEQAALLEVGLGSRAQLIVIDAFDELIDYLNSGSCQISGRVGFVSRSCGCQECVPGAEGDHAGDAALPGPPAPPSTQAPANEVSSPAESVAADSADGPFDHFRIDPDALPDLSEHTGVLGRADRLVKPSEKFPHLAAQLLADTWIVETLDVAFALSRGEGRGCRFVTLQGELLGVDGTLIVGSVQCETALVSRKSELRRLKHELIRLDRSIAAEEQRLSNLSDALSGLNGRLQTARAELDSLEEHRAARQSEHADARRHLEQLRGELESCQAEIASRTEQRDNLQRETEVTRASVIEAEQQLQELQVRIDATDEDLAARQQECSQLEDSQSSDQLELARQHERLAGLHSAFARLQADQRQRQQQRDEAERNCHSVAAKLSEIRLTILNTGSILAELALEREQIVGDVSSLVLERKRLKDQRARCLRQESTLRRERGEANDQLHAAEMALREIRSQMDNLAERIEEEYQIGLDEIVASGASAYRLYIQERYGVTLAEDAATEEAATESDEVGPGETPAAEADAMEEDDQSADLPEAVDEDSAGEEEAEVDSVEVPVDLPEFEEVRDELETRVARLRRKIKLIGSVNTDSLRDLDELEQRYSHLSEQLNDLTEARETLEEIVRRINSESKRMFLETFEAIRTNFQDLFRKAFGGGEGDIILEDPDDVLESGIDIIARPPGKDLRSNSLLSGGEKTLTAFALLLSIFRNRPSPYCFLDEVDAALDDANISRLIALLNEFKQSTQFVMITHRKPTMSIADVLYGVTMEESGVSKRLSVRFEDVNENGEFEPASGEEESSGGDAPAKAA